MVEQRDLQARVRSGIHKNQPFCTMYLSKIHLNVGLHNDKSWAFLLVLMINYMDPDLF